MKQNLKALQPKLMKCLMGVLIIGIFIAYLLVPIGDKGLTKNENVWMLVLYLSLIVLFVLIVTFVTNKGKLFEHRPKLSLSEYLLVGVLFLCLVVVYLVNDNADQFMQIFQLPMMQAVVVIASAFGAGFMEEYLVRGYIFEVLFYHLKKYRLLITSIGSSLIFGSLHFMNLTDRGAQLDSVLQQVFYATFIGLFFAALRITFNNLYVGACLHMLFDTQATLNAPDSGITPWGTILMLFLPIAITALVLIMSYDVKSKFKILPESRFV